jgi:hypothetical protein
MRSLALTSRVIMAVTIVVFMQSTPSKAKRPLEESVSGAFAKVGEGQVSSYAQFDEKRAPTALGLVFSARAVENPPSAMTDGHNCFDRNGDSTVDTATECNMWHEWVIPLPSDAARRTDIPFKWVLLNWNPHGHIPPGVWDRPHFDVHFYIAPIADVFAIEPGVCGAEFVDCAQFELGVRPVPANYLPSGFVNVDAVAPSMGNHLIDPTSPEFGGKPFTRTWIYGVFDSRITFWEVMLTQDYLLSQPDACDPIKIPSAVAQSGYYPRQYCVRYRPATKGYTVSLEGFEYMEAEPPGALQKLPSPQ